MAQITSISWKIAKSDRYLKIKESQIISYVQEMTLTRWNNIESKFI